MVKEDVRQIDELNEYKGQWKNLNFRKDGTAFFGLLIYDSEQAAKQRADELWHDMTSGKVCGIIDLFGGSTSFKNLSHIVQIPWGGK